MPRIDVNVPVEWKPSSRRWVAAVLDFLADELAHNTPAKP